MSPRTRVAVGKPAELAVDTSRLYFFDPQTRETRSRTSGQPLTAPAVRPAMIRFCRMRTMTISGTVMITVAAMTCPHGTAKALPVSLTKDVIASGTVYLSGDWMNDSA